jgi:hypothetical protein
MADRFIVLESNRVLFAMGMKGTPFSGSKSMACIKSQCVNVGDPTSSDREDSTDKQV